MGFILETASYTLILQMPKIQAQRGLVPSPRLSRTLLGQDTNTEQLPFLITEHINKVTLNNILKECFSVFIFGCAGSLLLHRLSLVVASRGFSLLQYTGFALGWLLLFLCMGFIRCGTRA